MKLINYFHGKHVIIKVVKYTNGKIPVFPDGKLLRKKFHNTCYFLEHISWLCSKINCFLIIINGLLVGNFMTICGLLGIISQHMLISCFSLSVHAHIYFVCIHWPFLFLFCFFVLFYPPLHRDFLMSIIKSLWVIFFSGKHFN